LNRLFVAYKPINQSSNYFLSTIKRRFGIKKAGFSGTLDPFACGVLIVAFGQYTKLFRFLKKSPKSYKATLWLGARSSSLDLERVDNIEFPQQFELYKVQELLESLQGEITYLPPKFSAKSINGKRAYELARDNKEFELNQVTSSISSIKLLNYCHPFITFKITISEGGYIRSIANIIANRLGIDGTLSYLERLKEGEFIYQDEKPLDPTEFLDMRENFYKESIENIILGRKLSVDDFTLRDSGNYFVLYDKLLTVIKIKDDHVKYILNGVKLSC
jgi:tRNA pseudouridine55 synthase